jgi:hypothetical protein
MSNHALPRYPNFTSSLSVAVMSWLRGTDRLLPLATLATCSVGDGSILEPGGPTSSCHTRFIGHFDSRFSGDSSIRGPGGFHSQLLRLPTVVTDAIARIHRLARNHHSGPTCSKLRTLDGERSRSATRLQLLHFCTVSRPLTSIAVQHVPPAWRARQTSYFLRWQARRNVLGSGPASDANHHKTTLNIKRGIRRPSERLAN